MKPMTIIAMAFAFATAAMGDPPKVSPCLMKADGKILYERSGTFRQYVARISGLSEDSASLRVGGTVNDAAKVEVAIQKSGRKNVRILFDDPPAVGNGESVLL